ncbi:MAG: hypothetical protein ABIK09_20345 [Pseudomonadota bacterium]
MRATPILFILLLLGHPAMADEAAVPDYVRIQLEDGPSPYEGVTYHIFRVGTGAAACQTHAYAHVGTQDVRCAALSPERMDRILTDLQAEGLLDLVDAGTPHPLAPAWRLDASVGGRAMAALIHGPTLLDDDRAARVIAEVLREVREATGVEIFRDIFLPAHKLGIVTFWTHPRTEVWVDGARISESTPVLSLDLPSGTHHLRFFNPLKGIDRSGRFQVTPGKSTNFLLNVIPNEPNEPPEENSESFEGTRD